MGFGTFAYIDGFTQHSNYCYGCYKSESGPKMPEISLMPLMKGIILSMQQLSPCSDVDPVPCAVVLKNLFLRKKVHLKLFLSLKTLICESNH